MTTLTQGPVTAGYLISESNGTRSREVVTLASGNNLQAGAVLAKLAATGKYTEHNPAGADGSEVAVAVLYAGVDASTADAAAVVTSRDAEVQADLLVWSAGISVPQKTAALADLAAVGIVVR